MTESARCANDICLFVSVVHISRETILLRMPNLTDDVVETNETINMYYRAYLMLFLEVDQVFLLFRVRIDREQHIQDTAETYINSRRVRV